MQAPQPLSTSLLTARDVQQILQVDRSTVYRMAQRGQLPSIRVGKQWRFPTEAIQSVVDGVPDPADRCTNAPTPTAAHAPLTIDPVAAQCAVDVAGALLEMMVLLTDMEGRPLTRPANPCPWFLAHQDEPGVLSECTAEWRELAGLHDLQPRFRIGPAGFECARAFVRSDRVLVGMVLAGGLSPLGLALDGCYQRTTAQRERVLTALPLLAETLSRHFLPHPA